MKAVLFDCDGTLVDTEYAHYEGWKTALNQLGHDLAWSDYAPYIGKSAETNAMLLAQKVGTDCSSFLLQKKRDYYKTLYLKGFPPIADTVQFLKTLAAEKKALGLKIGVCSAAKKEEILFHLERLGITPLLDIVLSGQDDLTEYSDPEGVNKPKPYIYLHAAKVLGIKPQEIVVIEDSTSGAWAGVTAGCCTIAIPNAYTKNHDFSHTHLRIDSFAGISIQEFFALVRENFATPS